MRLLLVNYEFPPVGGGAAYASFATARELVALGHRVDFLTAATPGAWRDDVIDGVRIFRVRCYRRSVHDIGMAGALSFVAFAAPRLRALASQTRYDVIHYYFGLPTGLLSRIPGAHCARPYIVSLRGSDVPGYTPQLRRYHRFMLPITRRIWRGAYRVIANSQDLRRLAEAAVPGLRIDVILNGAKPTPDVGLRSRPTVRVLAVSRLIQRKGLDTLIKALARSPNRTLHLDIAGEGPEEATLRYLAHTNGVGDRVHFHGFVDRGRLAALYADADVFALVSRAESCSMALLEAMSAGSAIVATGVGGNIELVQHDVNGLLVEPDNIDQLQQTLTTLASDPQQRHRFACANRALIEQRFGWRQVAQRYETLFRESARAPSGTATSLAKEPMSILEPPRVEP